MISVPEVELQLVFGNDLRYNLKILELSKTKMESDEPALVDGSESTTGSFGGCKIVLALLRESRCEKV